MKRLYFFILFLHCNFSFAQNAPVASPDVASVYSGMTTNFIKPLLNDSGDSLVLDTLFYNDARATVKRVSYTGTSQAYNWIKYSADSFFYGLDTVKYLVCNNYGCDTGIILVVVDFKFYDSYGYLDINNVAARFNTGGSNFWDMIGSASFEVPKGSGINSVFAESIWIGGKDDSNGLHLAAQRFKENGEEFYPGPLTDSTVFPPGSYDYYYEIQKWNRLWKINKSEVDYHISNWNQPGYVLPQIFSDWPAHGNTNYGQAGNLAPFFDYDNDGIYNPANGDYPLIKGDQAVYFILNDNKYHDNSGGVPLKVEIHGMAYAFNCTIDSSLQHTIFINYKFINRSPISYHSTYIGLWVDVDLGGFDDDYVGCDVQRGSFYFYNGDDMDADNGGAKGYGNYPPGQAITVLAGPHQDADGLDNPLIFDYTIASDENGIPYAGLGIGYSDTVADNERIGLCSFRYHNNNASVTGDSQTAQDYYYYMTDYWRDGTPMVYGGNGHQSGGGIIPANYMFPDTTDPVGWGTGGTLMPPWNEVSSGNSPSDRRGVGSVGPFTFEPGETEELDVAFVFGRDYQTTGAMAGKLVMDQRIDAIREMFVNDSTPCGGKFSIAVSQISDMKYQLSLFPNPASGNITVVFPSGIKNANYEICDLTGRKMAAGKIISSEQTISLKNFQCGIYFLRITDGEKMYAEKFVKN